MPSNVTLNSQHVTLLPTLTIGAAVSATATTPVTVAPGAKYVIVQARFLYGASGTSTKAYFQTSLDGGTTWLDVMSFAFTTSAATKISSVSSDIALTAATAPSDGAMTDNTIANGLLGNMFRVKYVTTGTYTGATSLRVDAIFKG